MLRWLLKMIRTTSFLGIHLISGLASTFTPLSIDQAKSPIIPELCGWGNP